MKQPGKGLPLAHFLTVLALSLATVLTLGVLAPLTLPVIYVVWKAGEKQRAEEWEAYERWQESVEKQVAFYEDAHLLRNDDGEIRKVPPGSDD